jgi:hypothetical protein
MMVRLTTSANATVVKKPDTTSEVRLNRTVRSDVAVSAFSAFLVVV